MRQAIFIAAQRRRPPGANPSDPHHMPYRFTLCSFLVHPYGHTHSFVRWFRATHEIARKVTDDGPETETHRNEPTRIEINGEEEKDSDEGTRNEELGREVKSSIWDK